MKKIKTFLYRIDTTRDTTYIGEAEIEQEGRVHVRNFIVVGRKQLRGEKGSNTYENALRLYESKRKNLNTEVLEKSEVKSGSLLGCAEDIEN